MKKSLIVCLLAAFMLLSFAGCTKKDSTPENETRTVVDMKGKTVEVPNKIESYCILYSSAVPMCAMVDENLEHLVMYPVSNYFEYWYGKMFEGINDHAVQVDKRSVTAEQILESGAQVVFWNRPAHEELVATLEEAGVACVNVQVKNSEDLLKAINVIAESFGTDFAKKQAANFEGKYSRYLDIVESIVPNIPESEKKTVLVVGSVDSPNVGPKDSYQGYWTELTGLVNVTPVKDGDPDTVLTMEEIYQIDPDLIIAQGPFNRAEINANPQWAALRAVKENGLFSNPSVLDEWGMPTSEAPLQFIWVVSQFYPNYIGDLNPVNELIEYYKDFYNYTMTNEDAEALLSCHHFYLHEALQDME